MRLAQCLLIGLLILGFFANLFWDVNGKAAKEPEGFAGVVGTIVIYTIIVFLYHKAGLFSTFQD